jgi:hypothetical protein
MDSYGTIFAPSSYMEMIFSLQISKTSTLLEVAVNISLLERKSLVLQPGLSEGQWRRV